MTLFHCFGLKFWIAKTDRSADRSKTNRAGSWFTRNRCFSWLAIVLSCCSGVPAWAEGSRNLFPATTTGSRASLEWRLNTVYAERLIRRTLLRVYLNQGEVLLLGSSAMGVAAGDLLVFNPGLVPGELPIANSAIIGQEPVNAAAASFQCSAQRLATGNATLGLIGSRAQELAGPDTIAVPATATPGGVVANGYTPCFYTAPVTGIYTVVISGPAGLGSNAETPPTGALTPLQTDVSQNTSVAAWDVTVRGSLLDPTERNGRLFAYYLALFTGNNGRPINPNLTTPTIFTLTTDGFLYGTGLRGIDPNGFVVYGNRIGFRDTDGAPLNRDLFDGVDDQLRTPQGGVTIAPPEFPLFFNRPDPAAIAALGIPLTPVAPVILPNSYQFAGSVTDNNSLLGAGGTFTYNANVDHIYEIVISRDGQNFDPTNLQNRVLRGEGRAGGQSVTWNGLDNNGELFPVGNNYPAQLIVRAGEYHFPLLDVENSVFGTPTYELLNPPGGVCPPGFAAPCTAAFYDDRGYRTANGTVVGQVNQPLPGGAPTPPNSNFQIGFDTRTADRAFTGFGDKKGLDLWTYFPSSTALTPLNIISSVDAAASGLRLVKRVTAVRRQGNSIRFSDRIDDPNDPNDTLAAWSALPPVGTPTVDSSLTLTTGDEVEYTIYFVVDGTSVLNDVKLCDPIPAGTSFIADSLVVQLGATPPAPRGTYYAPLVPLPAGTPCLNANNPNGSILVELGDLPDAANTAIGAVRFQVQLR